MQHSRCNACGASAMPNAEQNPNPLYNRQNRLGYGRRSGRRLEAVSALWCVCTAKLKTS